jgi:two-component system, OmpR family, alkaline phosphatase synthesis response regulator PhoP
MARRKHRKIAMPSNRILVVDDDSAIRRLVATILRREHYEVDTARGGGEALSMIELTHYDVVVLDLMMPEVSGRDVLNRLALRDPQIKCVVIMSAASRFYVASAITPNVYATVSKPFDMKALLEAVSGCIEAACNPVGSSTHLPAFPTAA